MVKTKQYVWLRQLNLAEISLWQLRIFQFKSSLKYRENSLKIPCKPFYLKTMKLAWNSLRGFSVIFKFEMMWKVKLSWEMEKKLELGGWQKTSYGFEFNFSPIVLIWNPSHPHFELFNVVYEQSCFLLIQRLNLQYRRTPFQHLFSWTIFS